MDSNNLTSRLKSRIKALIKSFIPSVILKKRTNLLSQWHNFKTLSLTYNQYQSIKEWDCIDKRGRAIAWYTYSAIEYLSNLDFSNKAILEYGSGNSSIFWASRAREVISIESDREWFLKISKKALKNQQIFLIQDSRDSSTQNSGAQSIDSIESKYSKNSLGGGGHICL